MKQSTGRGGEVGGAEIMSALLAAAHAVELRAEEALGALGLSMAKLGVLSILVEAGEPLPLSELAARMSCVRSNITQLVDRLEADGLVKRVADRADRRSIRAAITSLGETRQANGAQAMAEVHARVAASLPKGERDSLARALEALR